MPCDQVQEVEIQFGEATDIAALRLALEALGYTGFRESQTKQHSLGFDQGRFDGQTITFYDSRRATQQDALKRAYTKATVVTQAERFGWSVKAKAKNVLGLSRSW